MDELIEALTRALGDLLTRLTQEQLQGARDLAGQTLNALLAKLLELAVRGLFLWIGILARSLLSVFGEQAAFLQRLLYGTPPEMTTDLAILQATTRVAQVIAFAGLPAAIAWTGLGWQFSWFEGEDKREQAMRLLGGALLIAFLPWLCGLLLQTADALGMGLATFGGPAEGVVPGYQTITQAADDGIAVLLAGISPVGLVQGPAGFDAMTTSLTAMARDPTIMAGTTAVIYALALFFGAGSAFGRLLVIDALYCLAPLAALASMVPLARGAFAMWSRAFGTCVLVILPAGLVLKMAAGMMAATASGSASWVGIIATASVFIYTTLMGGACWGITLSTTRIMARIVPTLRNL